MSTFSTVGKIRLPQKGTPGCCYLIDFRGWVVDRIKKCCKKDLMNEFEIIFCSIERERREREERERRFYLASDGVNGLVSVQQRSHSTLTLTITQSNIVGQ